MKKKKIMNNINKKKTSFLYDIFTYHKHNSLTGLLAVSDWLQKVSSAISIKGHSSAAFLGHNLDF